VGILSEQEFTAILRMLQKLCEHVAVNVDSSKKEVQSFRKTTDVHKLASELEDRLPEEWWRAAGLNPCGMIISSEQIISRFINKCFLLFSLQEIRTDWPGRSLGASAAQVQHGLKRWRGVLRLNPKSSKYVCAPAILVLSLLISIPSRAQDAAAPDPAAPSVEAAPSADATPSAPAGDTSQPAQTIVPPQASPASAPAQASSSSASTAAAEAAPPDRPVSWLKLVPNLLQDQKEIWLFPISLARGHHILPTLIFTGITAGLAAGLDNPSGRYFQRTQSFNEFDNIFSDSHTAAAMFAFPIAFYGVGILRHDSYAQHTFLLAGEAAIDSAILTTVLKDVTRRVNPDNVPVGGNFSDPWFQEHGSYFGGVGSFPCGHCIDAFSVATVFADRYPKYKWVAYGLAGVVSFSRVSLQAHNPSDVFAGAFLGIVIAHYTVEQFH
jgi:membrane-associated phospholipid phosphatase